MNNYTDENLDFYTEVFLDLARADKIPFSLSDADLVAEAYLGDCGPDIQEPLSGPRAYLRRWSVAKGRKPTTPTAAKEHKNGEFDEW